MPVTAATGACNAWHICVHISSCWCG